MRGAILLVFALAATDALLHCPKSDRFPWMPTSGIDVGQPWETYPAPENACCREPAPNATFNAQEKCSLCYNLTKSTPGFAADPNNCQKFYMCEPAGSPYKWNVFPRICPNCTFWDQDKLTCVQVDPSCLRSVPFTIADPVTAQPENQFMFCIDFEDDDLVADNIGVYRPWILNDGVQIVNASNHGRVGFFNTGRLEIPFFSNAYSSFESLVISFDYKVTTNSSVDQGLISNDCFEGALNAAGNSLYASVRNNILSAGVKEPALDISGNPGGSGGEWIKVNMTWVDGQFELEVISPSNTFRSGPIPWRGPIRNSHCPLVIGSYIKDRSRSSFLGYMDNICFSKRY